MSVKRCISIFSWSDFKIHRKTSNAYLLLHLCQDRPRIPEGTVETAAIALQILQLNYMYASMYYRFSLFILQALPLLGKSYKRPSLLRRLRRAIRFFDRIINAACILTINFLQLFHKKFLSPHMLSISV